MGLAAPTNSGLLLTRMYQGKGYSPLSQSMQVEKGMHQADHHHGPLAHMLCLVYQEEHLRTQWLTAHSKNMDLAGCPEVKGSPLLGAVGEGHLLVISLLYCAQHVATIMPAILPCPCTGRKNTKRFLSQVTGQVVLQVTGQVVLQVTGQVVLLVTGQVVSQVTGQVVSQVTGQVVLQVTGQVVLQVTGQVVLQVTGQVVLQVTGQVVSQVTGQVVLQVTGQVVLQVTGQVVLLVTGQVVSQVTGQVVSQVTGQVVC